MPRPSLHPSKRATGSTPRRRDPAAATGRRGAHEPLRSPYSSRSRVDLTAARAAFARGLGLAMKRKGWSISETARQTSSALGGTTKFSTGHLWHYLHERALPRHAYLEALSRALDAPLRELLGAEHIERRRKRRCEQRLCSSAGFRRWNGLAPSRAARVVDHGT